MDGPATKNPYPWWKLKIWHGMTLAGWLTLLARYRCAVSPSRLHRFATVLVISVFSQLLAIVQRVRYAGRIDRSELPAPVFIIGHWRTGSTFLHELMAVDDRFVTPNAMQCMCPDHFLVSRPAIGALEFLLPENRPMDDFEVRWNAPQEDEFALLAMGARSPYEMFAFPRAYRRALAALDVDALPGRQKKAWQRRFVRFLKTVAFDSSQRGGPRAGAGRRPQYMLLKSPTHTARLGLLARMFPDARFIHLTRDRQGLFASSVSLWRALLATQSLHPAPRLTAEGGDFLPALALDAFDALYANFERDRAGIGEARVIDVRFADLTREPLETMTRLYRQLGIPLDERAAARLSRRIDEFRSYEAARHRLQPEQEALVGERWAHYPDRYMGARPAPE